MQLQRIEIAGFKSFFKKTIIEFREGITVIVGPNGCGKSNIVDAIRWAFGEHALSALRVASQGELLFSGSEAQSAVNVAQVQLIFDNSDNAIADAGSEIAVLRRLYRSGDSAYLLNNRPAKLKEIRALFNSMGVGFAPYSILEQGNTDRLLSAKTNIRREVFEEAAGIKGYRAKFAESTKRLQQVAQQMGHIRPLRNEVESQYTKKKKQVETLQKYRTADAALTQLHIERSLIHYTALQQRRTAAQAKLEQSKIKREAIVDQSNKRRMESVSLNQQMQTLQKSIETLKEKIFKNELEEERHRSGINNFDAHYQEIATRIQERNESIAESQLLLTNLQQREAESASTLKHSEEKMAQLATEIKTARHTTTTYNQDLIKHEQHISANKQQLQKNEKDASNIRKDIIALSEAIIAQLQKTLQSGLYSSRENKLKIDAITMHIAKQRKMIESAKQYLADWKAVARNAQRDNARMLNAIEETYTNLHGVQRELEADIHAYFEKFNPLLKILTDPKGNFVARHALDQRLHLINQKNYLLNTENADLESACRAIRKQIEMSRQHESDVTIEKERMGIRCDTLKTDLAKMRDDIEQTRLKRNSIHEQISHLRTEQDGITIKKDALQSKMSARATVKTTLNTEIKKAQQKITAGNRQIAQIEKHIHGESDKMHRATKDIERDTELHSKITANLEITARQFREQFGLDIATQQRQTTRDEQALLAQIHAKESALRALGEVNFMAPVEFSEIQRRYEILNEQYQDLLQAQQDIQGMTETITRQSNQQFKACVDAISGYFKETIRELFQGGRGVITLESPDTPLDSEITILVKPYGKSNEKIEHLSGGERALASLGLLFALYRHNPSAVAILDEVDAALDEENVARVAQYIINTLQTTQCIIISHNRRTMAIANSIIGISMEEVGISKVIEVAVEEYAAI